MTSDLFAAVRAAEEQADQTVRRAQQQARELTKQAQAERLEKERQAARENRALYQGMLDQKRRDTQSELAGKADAEIAEMDGQMTRARARLPEAVKFIMERVMTDGNR